MKYKISDIKDGTCEYSVVVIVLKGILPNIFDLSFLGFIIDVNFANFPLS